MENKNLFFLDGCIFPETEFLGFANEYKTSALKAFFMTVPGDGFREAQMSIARAYKLAEDENSKFAIAKTVDDIEKYNKEGKICGILYFQDPAPVENNFESLRIFYELGIRVIQLSYNRSSYFATGCLEESNLGLTNYGKMSVLEMNRLGILVDVSHCSMQTAEDVIKISEKPITICHSNIYNITKNPRNKKDEQLKLLAQNGGVLGLTAWAPILWKGIENKQPTLSDYVDHIEYAVNLMGEDHVGIASDNNLDFSEDPGGIISQTSLYYPVSGLYNKMVGTNPKERHVVGFDGALDVDNLAFEMQKRNMSMNTIEKILGKNFVRVFREVWK